LKFKLQFFTLETVCCIWVDEDRGWWWDLNCEAASAVSATLPYVPKCPGYVYFSNREGVGDHNEKTGWKADTENCILRSRAGVHTNERLRYVVARGDAIIGSRETDKSTIVALTGIMTHDDEAKA
jgi:hypothetical protein